MTLNERIAKVCKDTAGLRPGFVWKWAVEHGWKPRKGETPDGRNAETGAYLAWCAVTASYRVWLASRGAVTLCQGYKPGRRGVFPAGTDSVPVLMDWARANGLLVERPTPGCGALVEARPPAKRKDTPNHVGTVEDVGETAAKVREGNYAKRDALVTREIVARPTAKERVLGWYDVSRYAVNRLMRLPEIVRLEDDTRVDAPEGDDETADGIVGLGDDDLWVMPSHLAGASARARVTQETADGVFVQVIRDDGQVDMSEPELSPEEYVMLGRWEVP